MEGQNRLLPRSERRALAVAAAVRGLSDRGESAADQGSLGSVAARGGVVEERHPPLGRPHHEPVRTAADALAGGGTDRLS